MRTTPIRAVGLLSGGLDSALAARLMLDQGIDVIALHLESPTACRSNASQVAQDLGIPIEIRAKGEEYLRLLRSPRYGYGKNMNPCVDCRLFMFRLAQPYLDEFDARFVFTGEVVGQRPMSQTYDRIRLIDRQSGIEGKILRPLSAQLLPETEPEKRGWVDRSRLCAIRGRSRHEQLAMARRFGLRHYDSPGGGCLLTDAHFSAKLRDLFDEASESVAIVDVELLSVGRHFRVGPGLKVILGRDAEENAKLGGFESESRWLLEPRGFGGPTALVCGPRDEPSLASAIGLIARYTHAPRPGYEVRWREGDGYVSRPLGELGTNSAPTQAIGARAAPNPVTFALPKPSPTGSFEE